MARRMRRGAIHSVSPWPYPAVASSARVSRPKSAPKSALKSADTNTNLTRDACFRPMTDNSWASQRREGLDTESAALANPPPFAI